AADEPSVPPERDLKEAVALLKDVYEKRYAAAEADPEAKKALARKLFEVAPKRKTAPVQYACYDEARRLAARGGDARLALEALAALTTRFKGTPPDLAADTLKLLGDTELPPDAAAGLLALATEGAERALAREDYAGAVALARLRVAAAQKAKEPNVLADARRFLSRAEELKTAVDTIKTRPDDAAANEALGRYWAFTRGRWDVGLKHLTRGASKELAAAATKDLANPKTAKDRTVVADAWYKLARDYTDAERRRLIERAWEWYSAALAVATGDDDLKPDERVREIERDHPELFDRTLEGHTGAAAGVAVTPNGKTLVSVGNDGAVRLWDAHTGQPLKTLEGHAGWVGSVVVTPDGTHAVTAGGDNVIRVWDLKAQKEVRKLEGHTIAVRGLALAADGKTLISGGSDKTCRAWNLTTGAEIRRYGDGRNSVESVAVTPDGQYVLAGDDAGAVTVYDAKTGAVKSTYDKHDGTLVYTVATTRDGKTAVSAARDKGVHVWDLATGKELRRLKGHTQQVYQIAFGPGDKQLASASYDKTVRVWDFAGGRELHRFEGHKDGVQSACFAPDDRFVFSASWDKTVRKWRVPALPADAKKVD
ncbi:MAG: WD40 repeat domain-containing protein, partial [Planctomycetes bacterium]|nr:WD40 repeat domain-containing protein [Planctomycetota bacterium]